MLRRTFALANQEHGRRELRTRRGSERDRSREIGGNAEVSTNAAKDVVDRRRRERFLERIRAPPPIALERVIAKVDEAAVVTLAIECLLVQRARKSPDAIGQPRLGIGTCDQPGFLATVD